VKRSNYAKRRSISITFFIDMSINVDIFMHYTIHKKELDSLLTLNFQSFTKAQVAKA